MLVATVETAGAQSPDVEMGIDAAVQISIPDDGDNTTTVDVPFGRFRFGNYVSDRTLVELGLGFSLINFSGATASAGSGEASVSYHFTGNASRARAFLIVGGGGASSMSTMTPSGEGSRLAGWG
jgi:hypothetical protein